MTLREFERRLRLAPWRSKRQASALRTNLGWYRKFLDARRPARRRSSHALPGQPFDSFFLEVSPLFRRSRDRFLSGGGTFESRLVTSPRSLSSSILLENRIQYSPTEDELLWQATDPGERRNDEALLRLVGYSTSLFHEQNHRILWKLLPPPGDGSPGGLSRYLNFVEGVVVALDMALGDELGPKLSALGYLSGTLYDPGSHARFESARERRNYLHVVVRTTYLALELHGKSGIRRSLRSWASSWIPALRREALDHAISRALRLDPAFIRVTNPLWQDRHLDDFGKFSRKGTRNRGREPGLSLPRDPSDWIAPYLAAERVFGEFGT